ncbi:hypothetical protein ROP_pROB02-02380 (plasmid) [Rhodococcus opacus B4]|uniref:Uncharacterized protein n=1 Tax=Rhodococcus opacus (strain B4) TaxID=632772 RepID=C1BE42_RHOOB|nr:hypothetical protein ROP_pROB02-02380 [Rhodococcus opacus B4]
MVQKTCQSWRIRAALTSARSVTGEVYAVSVEGRSSLLRPAAVLSHRIVASLQG